MESPIVSVGITAIRDGDRAGFGIAWGNMGYNNCLASSLIKRVHDW
jgi:hypothetical protein